MRFWCHQAPSVLSFAIENERDSYRAFDALLALVAAHDDPTPLLAANEEGDTPVMVALPKSDQRHLMELLNVSEGKYTAQMLSQVWKNQCYLLSTFSLGPVRCR